MAILNPYSKTTYANGTTPSVNATNLNKNEQGIYDVTEKVRELAAYETNAAASAVSAASSASAAAASAAVYTDLVTVVADHAKYSTTEEIVIGTYDGKPLYRKALLIGSLPNTSVTNYPHGIANVSKIFVGNNSHAISGGDFYPLPFPHHVANYPITVITTATNVTIGTGVNRSTASATIFLEYTKTTD